jgi:hypothetical protein
MWDNTVSTKICSNVFTTKMLNWWGNGYVNQIESLIYT